jgi:hypothetical protein
MLGYIEILAPGTPPVKRLRSGGIRLLSRCQCHDLWDCRRLLPDDGHAMIGSQAWYRGTHNCSLLAGGALPSPLTGREAGHHTYGPV